MPFHRRPILRSMAIPGLAALLSLVLGWSLPASPAAAQAQTAPYPDRPIRIVVPYPPGGTTDPTARLLAAELSTRLGQPVIVDNKAGAAGSIGTDAVTRAAPDGYTLLLHTSAIATDPSFKKNTTYNVRRDLAPLMMAVTGPYLLVANPQLPVKNVAELISYAKANPGKINFGSAGQGSSGHLIGELFKQSAGISMVHVPYKGGGPSVAGLVGNEVQLVFDTVNSSGPLVADGRLRALAVSGPTRDPSLPQVPTIAESGLPDFSVVYWLGVFAPAKTPEPVLEKLHHALQGALQAPAVRERLATMGMTPDGRGTGAFARQLDADIARWKQVIETAHIEPQ